MSKEYLAPPINFKVDSRLETPYLRAKQRWDERLGSGVKQAANWRRAFFGCLGISLVLTAGNIYQMSRQTVTPMVIEVSKDTGRTQVIGDVTKQKYVPTEAELQYFVFEFIRSVREISLDAIVIRKKWERAYFSLRREAAGYLNAQANSEESPLKKIGEILSTIEPISFVKISANNSYQVRWKEEYFSKDGKPKEVVIMTGIFTFEIDPPKTEEEVLNNPLGVYIKSFQWSKER